MLNNQQQAIYDKVLDTLGNGGGTITAIADPGTGKTTMAVAIAEAAARKGYSVAMMAFTNANADDINAKLNHPRIEAKTSHKFGMTQFPGKFKIGDNRNFLYLKGEKIGKGMKEATRLISLAKALMCKSVDEFHTIAALYQCRLTSEQIGVAYNAFQLYDPKTPNVDDLVYYPAKMGWAKKQYDLVIFDEYQDSAPMQLKLAQLLVKPGGVLLAVGDPKQGIYAFRGGVYHPIEGATEHPLTLTYRFGQTIADHVNDIFGTAIECALTMEGQVTNNEDIVPGDNVMVIARTNAELFPYAIRFLANGFKVNLTNKYLLDGMILRLIGASHEEVCPNCGEPLVSRKSKKAWGKPYFLACGAWPNCKKGHMQFDWEIKGNGEVLRRILAELTVEAETADSERVAEIEDEKEIFKFLLGELTPIEAVDKLKALSQCEEGTVLTTCHKAKGLESDVVNVLLGGFVKCEAKAKELEDLVQSEQEKNLQFVAFTRARQRLNIVQ